MLLAAGRGERMRPLTDTTPKPLLAVQGQPLLTGTWLLCSAMACARWWSNTAWLGAQIPAHLNARWPRTGLQLQYSHEQARLRPCAGNRWRYCPCPALVGGGVLAGRGRCVAPDFVFDAAAAQAFVASERPGPCVAGAQPRAPRARRLGLDESAPGSGTGRALNLPPAPTVQAGRAAAIDLQHHCLAQSRAVDRAVVRAGSRQSHGRGRAAGTAAAPGHGCGALRRHALHRAAGPMWAAPERLAQLNAAEAALYKK